MRYLSDKFVEHERDIYDFMGMVVRGNHKLGHWTNETEIEESEA